MYEYDKREAVESSEIEEGEKNSLKVEKISLVEFSDLLNRSFPDYNFVVCGRPESASSPAHVIKEAGSGAPFSASDSLVSAPPQIVAEDFLSRRVTGLFEGSCFDVAKSVSIAFGCELCIIGKTFFFTSSQALASSSFVFQSSVDLERLNSIVALYPSLTLVAVGDRLLVRGPLFDIRDFYNDVRRLETFPLNYFCDVVFIRSTREQLRSLSVALQVNSVDLIQKGLSLYDLFSAYADFEIKDTASGNYQEQYLLVSDGSQSSIEIGNEKRYELRSISDMGTSTVSGFETISDGMSLKLSANSQGSDLVKVKLTFENSSFVDQWDKNRSLVDCASLYLEPRKVYYIGSFSVDKDKGSRFAFGLNKENSSDIVSVWLRVRPVRPVIVGE